MKRILSFVFGCVLSLSTFAADTFNILDTATGNFVTVTTSGAIYQNFSGLTRVTTPNGGALVREYADSVALSTGNIENGVSYNCPLNPATGVWGGRDVADICWLEKWSDTGGVKEIWNAPTAGAGVTPAWTKTWSMDSVNSIVTMGSGNTGIIMRPRTDGLSFAMYNPTLTPNATNYSFAVSANDTIINAASASIMRVGASDIASATSTGLAVNGLLTANGGSGAALSLTTSGYVTGQHTSTAAYSASGGGSFAMVADNGTAVTNGTRLGAITIGGARDVAHTVSNSVALVGYATENWGAGAAGSFMSLQLTPNGSTTRLEYASLTSTLFSTVSGVSIAGYGFHDLDKTVNSANGLTAITITNHNTYLTGTASASFAITLPAANAALNGAKYIVMSTTARPTTTWTSSGAVFAGAPSSLAAYTPVCLQYDHATLTWYISL